MAPSSPSNATANASADYTPKTSRFLSELAVPFLVGTCISISGTLGNLLFILSLFKEKKLRTRSNYLIGHSTFVDMLVCCLTIPCSLIVKAGSSSTFSCYLQTILIFLFPHLSMQAQCLVSCNRFFLLTRARHVYNAWFSRKRLVCYIAAGWTFAISILVLGLCLAERPVAIATVNCMPRSTVVSIHHFVLAPLRVIYFALSFLFYGKLIKFVRRNALGFHVAKRRETKLSVRLLSLQGVFAVCCLLSPLAQYLTFKIQSDSWDGITYAVQQYFICVMQMNYCAAIPLH